MYNPKQWFSLIFHSYSRRVMRRFCLPWFLWLLFGDLCYFFLDYFKLHEADFQPTIAMHQLAGDCAGSLSGFSNKYCL